MLETITDGILEPVFDPLSRYRFDTTWRFLAPIKRIWDEIYDFQQWPAWWKGVQSATRAPGAQGKGGRIVWNAPMGYAVVTTFRPTLIEVPCRLGGLFSGDLEGTGSWTLSMRGGITTARYLFEVRTTRPWVKLLSPVARPLFIWNHDQLMRQGAEGLARHLGMELLSK